MARRINSLSDYHGAMHSITSDNGTEFTNNRSISKTLNIDYYFAHPYASYERGSIENLNGLVRQYIPKGTDFSDVEADFVKSIECRLNNRPRKVLGFMTPMEYNEVNFASSVSRL
ncbi:IS30 family transposase [Francisellaceae bacterium]|nr:IS30 family transposase [Francisellaceae bacterium]